MSVDSADCNCSSDRGVEDLRLQRWGAVMDYLYSTGRERCDPRFCRTHANVAQLFAETLSSESSAAAWTYVAKAWNELADLKEMIAREKSRE